MQISVVQATILFLLPHLALMPKQLNATAQRKDQQLQLKVVQGQEASQHQKRENYQ